MQGRIYRQREIKDPEVQLILKNDRAEKRQKWRKEEKRVRKSVAGRVNTRRARTNRRMFQCQELDRLLSGITTCFERDNLGQWQLYADRLPEVASYLDEAEWVLPRLRKILKYLPNELESHK